MRRTLWIVATAALVSFGVGCEDKGDTEYEAALAAREAEASAVTSATPAPTSTVLPTPTPTPPSPPGPRRTGDADLDAIIEAVEAGDVDSLAAAQRLEQVECATESQGIGSPPLCSDEGVEPGTMLTVASGASCEGFLTTRPRALIELFVEAQDGLYAALDGSGGVVHLLFHGDLDHPEGVELWMRDGMIEVVQTGCIIDLETRADFLRAEVMVGPWYEPATPYEERVAALLAPVLRALASGDSSLVEPLLEFPFSVRGCSSLPEQPAEVFALLAAEGRLDGVYQRNARTWWLVYAVGAGAVRVEYVTPALRIRELTLRCAGETRALALDGIGRPLPRIVLPSQ
ncbi:MAG: hypothetical protein AB7F65_12310 [Dehalococcoidia bacterium]